MTKDQKKVLAGLGVLIGFKVVLWTGIFYAANYARKMR